MKFMLDSNAVIAVMKGNPVLIGRMKRQSPSDFVISSIVAHELYYGAYRSQRQSENLSRLDLLQFPVLEFDREDAVAAGAVRAALAAIGQPIGAYDVLIAGQAICRGLTLISRNLREFSRVEGLVAENWQD
jgi:tRNA(fMet)-specific endonuclease VapC